MVHTLELPFINKCVPKWVTISLTLFGLQDDIRTHFFIKWRYWFTIDLGVLYQTIFQYILNGYFVLNKGNLKGDILGLVKVWQNLYVCGIGLFSYLTYVHFWKIHTVWYIVDIVNKTSRDKGGVCANQNSAIRYRWYYPRSKLPFCGIL